MSLGSQFGYADDRYAQQRRLGFPWLRFIPEIEREFLASYIASAAGRIRMASFIGLASVIGFFLMDQYLGSNLMPARADWLLLGLTMPAIAVPIWATRRPSAGAMLQLVVFGAVLLMGLSVVGVIAIGRAEQAWFPWESLLLVTMWSYFVSGLLFYPAMLCGAVLWACFVVTNLDLQRHDVLLYEAYYLAVANGIGWLGLYVIERQIRTGWLLHHELRQQAVLDSLTGLMNRRAFTQHLEAAWLQAQRGVTSVGVMLLDLDSFKKINDNCGHPFGDRALQHVAGVLKASALRPLDAAARFGGDEFIAVWYDVDGAWFGKLAADLPRRIAGLECGKNMKVTVSGGAVVAWPRPGMAMRDAIKAADELLYEMKRNSPGQIGFAVLKPPAAIDTGIKSAG